MGKANIDADEVRRIARLAHLEYPRVQDPKGDWVEPIELLMKQATLEKLAHDLGQVLEYVAELQEVDVTAVEPTSHGVVLPTRFRPDEAKERIDVEEVLKAAPARIGDGFAVPKIVE